MVCSAEWVIIRKKWYVVRNGSVSDTMVASVEWVSVRQNGI